MPTSISVTPSLAVRACDTARPDFVAEASANPPVGHAVGVGPHFLPDGTGSLFLSIHVGSDVLMARLDADGAEWLMREIVEGLNTMIRADGLPPPGSTLN